MENPSVLFTTTPTSVVWEAVVGRVFLFVGLGFVFWLVVVCALGAAQWVWSTWALPPVWWVVEPSRSTIRWVLGGVTLVSFVVACVFPLQMPPQGRLERAAPSDALRVQSAALAAWALATEAAAHLPKEPTTWSVTWKPNAFGVHAEQIEVADVSGRTILRWNFSDLPEAVRFVPCDPVVGTRDDRLIKLVYTAALPPVTAHVRMQVAHAGSPQVSVPSPLPKGPVDA